MILSEENYYSTEANRIYMSVSQYKQFEKCQCSALAELNGEYIREKTPALLVGSYVDSYFDDSLDKFKSDNPEIFKKDGSLKSEYIKAEQLIKRIEQDKMFSEYISGAHQVIMTGEIGGVPVKVKMDSYFPNEKIVDLKTTADFQDKYAPEQGRMPWWEFWRYDLQGAVYQEIVRQNTGETLPFYLAAITKEKTPDIGIYKIPQNILDFELERFTENVGMYQLIKSGVIPAERCESCDYCKQTKILTDVIEIGDLNND